MESKLDSTIDNKSTTTKLKKNKPQPLYEGVLLLTIKIILFRFLWAKMNFFLSLGAFFSVIYVYHLIIYYVFNLTALCGYDKVFITTNPVGRYQILSLTRYKDFDVQKMYNFLIEKMIKNIPRLRTYMVKKFLEYYWFTDTFENIKNKLSVKILPKLKNYAAVEEYISSEMNVLIDIFNELPWEMQIIPYGENREGVVLLKTDHLLSDGLGLVSMDCVSSDKFSINTYPKIMQRLKGTSFLQEVYLHITAPFYGLYLFLTFAIYGIQDCPFKANKKPNSAKTLIAVSKEYKLADFQKFRKRETVSFNDIMLTVFSISMNNLLKSAPQYSSKNHLVIDLPVGRKAIPKRIEEVDVCNEASGVLCDIPFVQKPGDVHVVRRHMRRFFRPEAQLSVKLMADFFGNLLPWQLLIYGTKMFNQRFDFMFTNVPGPAEPLVYHGTEMIDMMTFPRAGGGLPFVTILSYTDHFKFVVSANENSDWDVKILLEELENVIKMFII